MKIKPIRTAKDHRAALRDIERLWGAPEGSPEGDDLEVLITLVDDWEKRSEPIPPPDPIEAIEFRMEQAGLSRADLEEIVGHRGRISEVLNRKRPLSISMIRRLHEALGIPAEVLIRKSA